MWSSVLACYGNFFHGFSHSTALEVRTLACLAAADVRSVTGSNLRNLSVETWLDPRKDVPKMKKAILDSKCPVPEMDTWRILCLQKYLALRYTLDLQGKDKSVVEDLILSLVTSQFISFLFRGIQTLSIFWSLLGSIKKKKFFSTLV